MPYTFDGPNRLVILDSSSLSVEDMYSRWVDWVATSDNAKFLMAIRCVGGDPISSVKKLGVTFFMTNGWRIRPMEATHRLAVLGNLFTDPAGDSPFVSTVGSFNVMIESSVSSLVDSTVQQLPEIEHMVYGGAVHLDTARGVAGTAYPVGSPRYPVRTLSDALVIAAYRGFRDVHIEPCVLVIGAAENVSELNLAGSGIENTQVVLTPGCSTNKTSFKDLTVSGTQSGETHYEACEILSLSNVHCRFVDCLLIGPMSMLQGSYNGTTVLYRCYTGFSTSSVTHDEFVVDLSNSSINMVFAQFSGKMKIINLDHATTAGTIEVNMNAGRVTIDASCTKGVIKVRGAGEVVDLSAGTLVDSDVVLPTSMSVPEVALAVWNYPLTGPRLAGSSGSMIQDSTNRIISSTS